MLMAMGRSRSAALSPPTENNNSRITLTPAQGHELHHFLTATSGSRQHHVSNLRLVRVEDRGVPVSHWRCGAVQEIAQTLQCIEEGHATIQRTYAWLWRTTIDSALIHAPYDWRCSY